MKENELLWVKVNKFCNHKDQQRIRDEIMKQLPSGVVVLPSFCEPVIITDKGIDVRVGNEMRVGEDGTI